MKRLWSADELDNRWTPVRGPSALKTANGHFAQLRGHGVPYWQNDFNVSALSLISLKAGLMYAVNAIDEAIDSSS